VTSPGREAYQVARSLLGHATQNTLLNMMVKTGMVQTLHNKLPAAGLSSVGSESEPAMLLPVVTLVHARELSSIRKGCVQLRRSWAAYTDVDWLSHSTGTGTTRWLLPCMSGTRLNMMVVA
jgi:hypothetical protein